MMPIIQNVEWIHVGQNNIWHFDSLLLVNMTICPLTVRGNILKLKCWTAVNRQHSTWKPDCVPLKRQVTWAFGLVFLIGYYSDLLFGLTDICYRLECSLAANFVLFDKVQHQHNQRVRYRYKKKHSNITNTEFCSGVFVEICCFLIPERRRGWVKKVEIIKWRIDVISPLNYKTESRPVTINSIWIWRVGSHNPPCKSVVGKNTCMWIKCSAKLFRGQKTANFLTTHDGHHFGFHIWTAMIV